MVQFGAATSKMLLSLRDSRYLSKGSAAGGCWRTFQRRSTKFWGPSCTHYSS